MNEPRVLRSSCRPSSSASTSNFQFASGYLDSRTKLYKFGLRYYDPEFGRFTQRDPAGLEGNTYIYAACNPINYADPSGAQSCGTIFESVFVDYIAGTKTFSFNVQGYFTFSYTARVYGLAPEGVYSVTVGGWPLSGDFRFSASFPASVENIALTFFSLTIVGPCYAEGGAVETA